MKRFVIVVTSLLVPGFAAADAELHLDLKTETHHTVMTAPIGGAFLGGSLALGAADAPMHPRAWLSVGGITGLESTGLAFEAGGSLAYYGGARREGFGVALDVGASVLRLVQHHDQERLVAVALIAEPSIAYTWGRMTALVGLRLKNVVYEHLDAYETKMTTSRGLAWKPEAGLKAGVRVAF
jgi:hypothetical protein